MPGRSGFTLIELLVAGALSVVVLGLATQQLMNYFRLQQVLMTRTQLRQEAHGAMARVAKHMRYCPVFGESREGPVGLKPVDVNHDGVIMKGDRYELLLWRTIDDPLKPDRQILQEQTVNVPAFAPPAGYDEVLPFFAAGHGQGRRLASFVEKLELSRQGPALVRVQLDVEQAIEKQPEPVTVTVRELVGIRSDLIWAPDSLPTIPEVLEQLKKDEDPA
jgi:prepilin-type N-terminal cleavage/methylation domain-containing protein